MNRFADTPSASRTSPSTRDEEESNNTDSPTCRPPTRRFRESLASRGLALLLAMSMVPRLEADSVVVFNEVMYHPAVQETQFEWVELHNQMAVDVDLSGWSIAGGIDYSFPEGTRIAGGGYRVIALSPTALQVTADLTNVLGPFTGRLSNAGDTLRLLNRSRRLMDEVVYGVDGEWPVAPDGSGVSLAKADEDAASGLAENWTVSALVGGTPGARNFADVPFTVASGKPIEITGAWRYCSATNGVDPAWKGIGFDDQAWASGNGLFRAGEIDPPTGDPEVVPTVFSSGLSEDRVILAPGSPDPHYWLIESAHSTPPPPAIRALVIQNHPAWLANDATSSWIGPVNPGTADVAGGSYDYRTAFSLAGFDVASTVLKLSIGADNRLLDVLLNGVPRGISYAGFSTMSGEFTLATGFQNGANTLEFHTANDGASANPAGFRARLSATARRSFPVQTVLPAEGATYLFRAQFPLEGRPDQTRVRLGAIVADGAVFYLNGAEVLRWNMPSGPVNVSTPASSNVLTANYNGPFELPNAYLVAGTNVLAVEVHRGPASGGGVLFGSDVSLTTTNILVPPPVALAFNEVAAASQTGPWLELINHGTTALNLGGYVLARVGEGGDREFVLGPEVLGPGDVLALSPAALGFGAAVGDRLFLFTPARDRVPDAVVVQDAARGRHPDGRGLWWYPTVATPGASNVFDFHDEVIIHELMYHPPDIPPEPGLFGTNFLVEITDTWRYHSLGEDLGTAWRMPGYDAAAWPVGQALFFHTTSVLPAPKNTLLPLTNSAGTRIVTWYFRTPFVFGGQTNSAQLTLHPMVDDGAVYYLNGVEILRQNMPDGPIEYGTLAPRGVATPAYSGPWTIEVTNLVTGTNLLAVEVHQFTTNPIAADMAFGVEVVITGQLSPPTLGGRSNHTWIELFNGSDQAVNLTGWRVSGEIEYAFPPGTTIAAQDYLVIAKEVATLVAEAPDAAVVGPFDGNLRRSGGKVLLLDAAGNPADAVDYRDAKPWPEPPDGGGSSLELQDPWADNARPESWAASDESTRSEWCSYSYRAVAVNRQGPTLWKEFVLGLLDVGECLLDDVMVVEDPDGTAVSLLQNGHFESGLTAWRALGDHNRSRVVTDPDNPANHVLHLVATGPTDHLHNHLETTLAAGRSVTDGRLYQVSFRAKWLTGNHRLNTRLYFNRVARTTELLRPIEHGTPGRQNSTRVSNLGPTFIDFGHSPVVPPAGEPVTVSVGVHDPQGIGGVDLFWSADGAAWRTNPMTLGSAGSIPAGYARYAAVLPGLPAGTLVQFYVQATDTLGALAAYPAGGRSARALFKVDGGEGRMTRLHRFQLLMTADDADFLHAHTNVMSMDRLGLTVVYDEREVFYDAGVHLQGSQRGRDNSFRVGFTVRLNADKLFRGVQNGFTLDRSGGYSGRGGRHDELLLWRAVNHAGGLLGIECDLAQVFAPRAQENSTALLRVSDFDADYWDGQFTDGADGNLYTLELIYYPTTTTTGDPQAAKLPQPDEVIGSDIQDLGEDPENYRWQFLQENHADQDDYRQIVALSQAFSLTGAALENRINQLVDTDEFLRTLAFKAFTGDVDTYTYGYTHNWKFYFRPEDGRALGLLWDMDFSFVQSIDAGFPGSASPNTYRIVTLPNNHRRYSNHLYDLLNRSVNPTVLGPWASHYAGLLGENWTGALDYLQQRADFIRSRLPLTTAFAITSNGGRDFATTNSSVVLIGNASIQVKDIQVNGVTRPLAWTSQTSWTLTAPLPAQTNLLVLQGLDNDGNALPNATDAITVLNQGALALRPVLINEWMADNAGPGGFLDPTQGGFPDWFELYNPNEVTVDLSGYSLTDTLTEPAKWQIPTGTTIPAAGFLLVWADRRPDLNAPGQAGEIHADFQLDNDGEAIGLSAPNGPLQHAVFFGPQLENVSQGLLPDGNTEQIVWMPQWTPRAPNTIEPVPPPIIGNVTMQSDGAVTFTVVAAPNRAFRVDSTEDLVAPLWIPLAAGRAGLEPVLVTDLARDAQRKFYRVVLLP